MINGTISYQKRPCIPYVFPFALFAVCIYAGPLFNISQSLMYPIKTVLVASSLIYYWNVYKQEIRFSLSWLPVISGILVFFIWVLPDGGGGPQNLDNVISSKSARIKRS